MYGLLLILVVASWLIYTWFTIPVSEYRDGHPADSNEENQEAIESANIKMPREPRDELSFMYLHEQFIDDVGDENGS